jgi:Fe-S-cluster containining protein
MEFEIDWRLPEAEFRQQIDNLIRDAYENKMVLPLPCHISMSKSGLELLALILSQINCSNCDAVCCRSLDYIESDIPLLKTEYRALVERIGEDKLNQMGIKLVGNTRYLPRPCPLLNGHSCSVHDIRPNPCINYPFEKPATDSEGLKTITLDSFCPEARRITRDVYMMYWKLFNKMQEIVSQGAVVKDQKEK